MTSLQVLQPMRTLTQAWFNNIRKLLRSSAAKNSSDKGRPIAYRLDMTPLYSCLTAKAVIYTFYWSAFSTLWSMDYGRIEFCVAVWSGFMMFIQPTIQRGRGDQLHVRIPKSHCNRGYSI